MIQFKNYIAVITDNEGFSNTINNKISSLAEIDCSIRLSIDEALKNTEKLKPALIVLHCESDSEKYLDFMERIHKDIDFIVFKTKSDSEFNKKVFGLNAIDIVSCDMAENEIFVRIRHALDIKIIKHKMQTAQNLLEQNDIIDIKSGFYTTKHSKKIFEKTFEKLNNLGENAIFMLVSPNEECKIKAKKEILSQAISKSVRSYDVVSHASASKFYILLKNTGLSGAITVWGKIKNNLDEDYGICCAVCDIENKTFDEASKNVANAIYEAINMNNELVIVENETPQDDWLEETNPHKKNFKLFKRAFEKKLEKVVTPVFFKLQKTYEDNLFDTKINQESSCENNYFKLKSSSQESVLKITYPGYSKINIDITHLGLDSPENRRISFEINELDEAALTFVVDSFVKEYKECIKV